MTKETREKWNTLKYEMEKNSFLLSVLEARLSVVLHAESMGYSDSVTALIAKISPQYVKMLRAIKDKHGGSIEDMAQIAFDKVYVLDGSKRDFSKFRHFDTDLLTEWFALKQREQELMVGLIEKDELEAQFQQEYMDRFGIDIEIHELPRRQEQQELEEANVDSNTWELEVAMRFLVKLARAGGADLRQAYLVMNQEGAGFTDYDVFLRSFDAFAEKEDKQDG